ncbi:bifunctional DNA primase/polymerase-like protein [Streptomyces sp. TLI_235]|nr:bifunctional DNA primase/polymerase [Streptomyces sp. TLI_235]PBC78928.1 bifunctional DNA primase/polymerase-like protein [Streptomyces sp. TLI_235]
MSLVRSPHPLRDETRRPAHKVCAEQHATAETVPMPSAVAAAPAVDDLLTAREETPLTDWQHALTAAHHAIERGFAAFPTGRTKRPAVPSPHPPGKERNECRAACGRFGHGVLDATTDHQQIDALFAAAPWATGYGIACGRAPYHLVGLDLDRKNGLDGVADLARLAAEHGFTVPTTATVATPSGGLHAWLASPPGSVFPNSVGKVAPGIDVRGPAGYLVGPGSLGTAGRYVFAPGTDPNVIAPCPPALLALLNPPPAPAAVTPAAGLRERVHHQKPYVRAAIDRETALVRAQKYPGRAKRLFASAAALGRHIPTGVIAEDLAFDALMAAGTATGLSHTECEHTIRRGLARGAGSLRPAA